VSLGFRVITTIKRPPLNLVEKFLEYRTCDLSDVMNRAGTMVGIHGVYSPIARIAGPAVTVSIPAGGINMVKLGIQQARSGDVMVVSAHGDTTYALMGGNISLGMQARGLKGFVIDGGIRDVSELRQLAFPTFARGVACAAADLGPPRGEVNVPIACGGVVVNPGDIIIADEDGVVVVPPHFAKEVLAGVPTLSAQHEKAREILRTGQMTAIERITADFISQGLEIVPGTGEGAAPRGGSA
jgi:4-hydroxy-4-methyl-2-oxoglutarate aldolase